MDVCPVCHVKRFNPAFSGCEMRVDGRLVRVCSDCYHKAFLKTNLSRMRHAPRKSFFD